MPERLSKIVLALEALLIATPLTALYFYVLLPRNLLSLLSFRSSFTNLLVTVVIVLSLLAGWSLMVTFWRSGAAGLRRAPSAIWGAAYAGAAAAVWGPVSMFAADSMGRSTLGDGAEFVLIYGIPLLVPFAHLLAERLFRSSTGSAISTLWR